MNKIVGFGLAVVLCMAAAGFGAYLALRPQTAAIPSAAVEQAASQLVQAPVGAAGVSGPAETVAAAPAQSTAVSPLPAVEAAKPEPVKPPSARPSVKPAGGTNAGGEAAAPPVSNGDLVAEKPVEGVSAGAPPEAVPVAPPAVAEPVVPQEPPPPQRTFEELVVSAESVIGLRLESTISSEVAKVEDPVEARVTRDVRVGSSTAIPSGTRVLGSVVQVERGGKMKTAAKVGVRFHTLALADGTRLSINSEAIYREGKSPGQESAAKVGGAAVGGAILGAIFGGGKGAAIGGAVGAAGGTGAVMAGGRNPAVLTSGTSVTVRLREPVTVVIERDEYRD